MNYSAESLNLTGYRGEQIPHTFYRQHAETRHLAVVFPGLGYTAHMPLVYYPARLLMAHGADVLRVETAYNRHPVFRSLDDNEQNRWLTADAEAAFNAAFAQRAYTQVTLVGKSIGTQAMGHLLSVHLSMPALCCVWLTPLLRNDVLRSQIVRVKHRALFVIGSSDPHYEPSLIAELERAMGGKSIVVEGANHSLEIGDDILQSIRALERVIAGLERFLFV